MIFMINQREIMNSNLVTLACLDLDHRLVKQVFLSYYKLLD